MLVGDVNICIYIYGFSIKGWHQVYKMVLSCLVLCVEEGSLLSKCSTNLKPWSTKKRPEGRLKHWALWSAAAKSLPSCPTLCDPIDGSLSGSPIPGSLQARTLERVAISFSNAGKWKVKLKSLSCVRLLATPWTAVYQASPSRGFFRQEYWSGVPLPSPALWSTSYQLVESISLSAAPLAPL